MTKHLILLLAAAALAACGSPSTAATTPAAAPTSPSAVAASSFPRDQDTAGGTAAVAEPAAKQPERAAGPGSTASDAKTDLLASETAAWETARPILEKACATCHTSAGTKASRKKLGHFSFDSYPPSGHHTSTIGFTIRDVLGLSGKKPTMPYDKPGSVQGDDLAKIKMWTDAWEAAENGGAHPPAGEHQH